MCWIPYESDDRVVITAKEPVRCFKVMFLRGSNVFLSKYQGFEYEKDCEYSFDMKEDKEHGSISEGIHSYSDECIVQSNMLYGKDGYVLDTLREGLVSIVECFIPSGALYYLNSKGEIVSNRIRIGSRSITDHRLTYGMNRLSVLFDSVFNEENVKKELSCVGVQ